MRMIIAACVLIAITARLHADLSDDPSVVEVPDDAVAVDNVYLRLIDSSEIPALERGQLSEFVTDIGESVEEGMVVASLDSAEAELSLELAALELKVAECQQKESVSVETAGSALREAEQLREQARVEAQVATAIAGSDLAKRAAERNLKASSAAFDRAMKSRERFATSVSDEELDKLTLARDQDHLKIEETRFETTLNALRSQSRERIVKQQDAAVERLELSLKKARNDLAMDELKLQSLQKSLQIQKMHVERRQVRAPFTGVIVERLRSCGEWVEPGQPVLRIVRLDQLYAEGHIDANSAGRVKRGTSVLIRLKVLNESIDVTGKIVFVSPEIDAVNQHVTVRAELANTERKLNPGQTAQMWITPK